MANRNKSAHIRAMRPLKPTATQRSRKTLARSYSKTILPYSGPILFVTAVLIVSAIYYFAIAHHNVELSFDQLSAFERQVTTIGNRSLYVVEPPRYDEIFTTLPMHVWAKLSSRIDYVAFVYDDLYSVMNSAWLRRVAQSFDSTSPKGYGIVLFSCGCVVPNIVFTRTKTRFNGSECTMLPGFVVGNEAVRFLDVKLPDGRCKRRDQVLRSKWYEDNVWKLEDARREHAELRRNLSETA